MAKITYDNKVALNPQPSIADINKVSDADMNEIKSSVNALYDFTTPEEVDLSSITTWNNSFVNNQNFVSKIYKIGKLIVMNVHMNMDSYNGTEETNVMYLPVSLRPTCSVPFVVQAYLYGGWTLSTNDILGRINTDGYVKLRPKATIDASAKTISIHCAYVIN